MFLTIRRSGRLAMRSEREFADGSEFRQSAILGEVINRDRREGVEIGDVFGIVADVQDEGSGDENQGKGDDPGGR